MDNTLNKRTGILLIVLTFLAIIGIAITQIYWIKNAYELKKTQLDQRIQVGLRSVSNTLFELQNADDNNNVFLEEHPKNCPIHLVFEDLNYSLLDSLLSNEFLNQHIESTFEYGVYLNNSKHLIGGNYKYYEKEILQSEFKTSLSCLRSGSPYVLGIYIPESGKMVFNELIGAFLLTGCFVLIIGFSFIYTTIITYRQKKVSIIKNDFVNNMTHEFKTPISTVSLASEMLLRDDVQKNSEKTKKYAQIIFDENARLKNQVEEVLQLAVLDQGRLKIKKKEIDIHKLLNETINNSEIFILERKGRVRRIFAAARHNVYADKMHITNVISSLLDNANKYSPDKPEITIRTKNIKNGILISVEDKGIGIKTEDQAYIFKRFHRVHTGNIHDVKGFGLGLFYTKKMVEEHGGFIRLNSTFGSGSIFELYLPFNEIRKI